MTMPLMKLPSRLTGNGHPFCCEHNEAYVLYFGEGQEMFPVKTRNDGSRKARKVSSESSTSQD